MAKLTTNFSSWSLIETILNDISLFENGPEYNYLQNTISDMASYLFNISDWGGTSSLASYSDPSYTAYMRGSNLDKSNGKITAAGISDEFYELSLAGSVKVSNGLGTITSVSFQGDGYSESVSGKIY